VFDGFIGIFDAVKAAVGKVRRDDAIEEGAVANDRASGSAGSGGGEGSVIQCGD
jgi:hypothetical protein